MTKFRALLQRITALFHRDHRDADLAAELESHLQFHIEDNLRAGMSAEEARRQALIKLGGLDQTKESVRARRGLPWLEHWICDARISVRVLAKDARFSILAILGLALGLGVSTAIFALINASATAGDRAAVQNRSSYVGLYASINGRAGYDLSYDDYRYYQTRAKSFSLVNAESGRFSFVLGARQGSAWLNQAEDVEGRFESEDFLSVLGLRPPLGRIFSKEEALTGSQVAVLNFRFWKNHFGGDERVLGKTIVLNAHPLTIVGIASANFATVDPSDIYLPLELEPTLSAGHDMVHDRASRWLHLDARLQDGVTSAQSQAELNVLLDALVQSRPVGLPAQHEGIFVSSGGDNPAKHAELVALAAAVIAIVSMILLIACANLASILLARAVARRREIGVRLSLGASRARVISMLMTESILLACAGGATGLLFAHSLAGLLFRLIGAPDGFVLKVDPREFIYAFSLSVASAVCFGLGPALVATQTSLYQVLHSEGLTGAPRARSQRIWAPRNMLVIAPLTMSLMLLLAASATLRGMQQHYLHGPNFDTSRLTALRLELTAQGYSEPRTREFQEALLQRIAMMPGVTSVALASNPPLADGLPSFPLVTEASIPGSSDLSARAAYNVISPDFFRTIGISIERGRNFTAADRQGAAPVAIVNRSLAGRYWSNEEPLGKRIRLGNGTGPYFQVVGVTPDFEDPNGPLNGVRPTVYVPYGQEKVFLAGIQTDVPPYQMQFLVRTSVVPSRLKTALSEEVRARDQSLIVHIATIREMLDALSGPIRTISILLSALGGLALVMAAVGIYAIMAYTVSQQTKQIGIRVALGASRRDILSMVIRRTLVLIVWGLGLGLAGALAADRIFSSVLADFGRLDAATCTGASLLLVIVTLFATYVPARKALRVDPMAALRHE